MKVVSKREVNELRSVRMPREMLGVQLLGGSSLDDPGWLP